MYSILLFYGYYTNVNIVLTKGNGGNNRLLIKF